MSKLIKGYIVEAERALVAKKVAFSQKQAQIMERHVAARERLHEQQAERWAAEMQVRTARFRKGIGAVWDWLTGKSKKIARDNGEEALRAIKRDDREREDQRQVQLQERRLLQDKLAAAKKEHAAQVAALRADIASYLDLSGDRDQHHDDASQQISRPEPDRGNDDRQRERGGDFEI